MLPQCFTLKFYMIWFHEIPKLILKATIMSYKYMYWTLKKTTQLDSFLGSLCYSLISTYANLPNFSCHFWKHKSVFLQILYQSSVPSYIPPLYFFSSNIIYFGQISQLKSKFFRFLSARVKIRQTPHVKFEMTSQFLFKFCIILYCHDT